MPLSILTIAQHIKRASRLSPHVLHFFFLCTAKFLSSICFPITILTLNSLLPFLYNSSSVKTVFKVYMPWCTAVSITILIIFSLLAFTTGGTWLVQASSTESPGTFSTAPSLLDHSHSSSITLRYWSCSSTKLILPSAQARVFDDMGFELPGNGHLWGIDFNWRFANLLATMIIDKITYASAAVSHSWLWRPSFDP